MNTFHHFDLGYCELFIMENYVIKQVREGQVVKPEETNLFLDVVQQYFKDRPFVYLSNRAFSYSVNPVVYLKAENLNQLIGIGIIARGKGGAVNAQFERHFYNKPFEVFEGLREAIDWADDLIKNHSSSAGRMTNL
ncbi:hypothetical protein [Nonlabens xiamenensis]|uniref:hypothetical protein n=1 Tax=Nonlabens xiamenensis TaxID=2341043 RepID=UPI000F614E99|nr:hypothetical protein [Nonlabens xiamenensis]